MDEIERILESILSRYDLSTPEGRTSAYEACVEYAENELSHDLMCNTFLRRAAELLEKEPVEIDVVRELVDLPSDALLDISYDERHGLVITGNPSGLQYLSDILNVLAEAPQGEHVHLFNDEEPLTPVSFNAVFYVEDDDWFRKLEEENMGGSDKGFRIRNIPPEEIFAIQVIGEIPSDLPITRDHIYKVLSWSNNSGNSAWRKKYSGDSERFITFEIEDDNGYDFEIELNLDDPDVNYFRKSDIESLLD